MKYICSILLVVFFLSPFLSNAQSFDEKTTRDSLLSRINELLKIVSSLQKQLAELTAQNETKNSLRPIEKGVDMFVVDKKIKSAEDALKNVSKNTTLEDLMKVANTLQSDVVIRQNKAFIGKIGEKFYLPVSGVDNSFKIYWDGKYESDIESVSFNSVAVFIVPPISVGKHSIAVGKVGNVSNVAEFFVQN